ncbi:MAG: DEAD/DEAH box helicase [Actinomycetota bacterium]
MSDQHTLGLDVLAYWRAIEYLTPASPDDPTHKAPAAPKADDRDCSWDVAEPTDLPWQNPGLAAHYAPTDKEAWRFVLTVGFSPIDDAMDELRQLLGGLPDDEERPGGGGDMALASFVVTEAGIYDDAAAVAPMPWAMGKLRAGQHPRTLEDFPAFEKEMLEGLDKFLRGSDGQDESEGEGEGEDDDDQTEEPKPVTVETLHGVCDLVTNAAGWQPRRRLKLLARIRAVRTSIRKDGTISPVEPDILGSFFAADLTRVRNALDRGDNGAALSAYLYGLPPQAPKTDVIADPTAAARWLSPAQFPAGRWPSKPHERLVAAQQMAVNAAFARLGGKTGLFSVNGPPGTGKTTLLRDLVAAIIVERARVLMQFEAPGDAFTDRGQAAGNAVWRLDDRLKGFEMVVASTNNGAVENVTVELPGLDAIDPDWRPESTYFPAVARTLLDPDPGEQAPTGRSTECWALIAAVLGNRRNRSRFVDRFWWVEPGPGRKNFQGKPLPPHWQSFKAALNQLGRTPPDWQKARAAFRERLAEVEALLAPAKQLEAALARHDEALAALTGWDALERDLDAHDALRPGALSILRQPANAFEWRRRGQVLADRFDAMTRQLVALGGHVKGRGPGALAQRRQAARALADQAAADVARLRQTMKDVTAVDGAFFALPVEEREKSAPWLGADADRSRKRCFLAALDLHRAFLAGAHKPVLANLGQAVDLLKGKLAPADCQGRLSDLWGTLFLAVPVVSTTFASFPRLFPGMGCESLGWLLVDEAGQATPQAAAGAIWRAKRAVVIGDPLQIEPVVPLPAAVIENLREKFGVPDRWHPIWCSAQVLADRANPVGGRIQDTWVGSPLRVHRRCSPPMFGIANAIAYNNLMVFGDVPSAEMPLGPSRWLDVAGLPAGEGHFIPAQGEATLSLLHEAHAAGRLGEVFVISPFRTVAEGMRTMARRAKLPPEWVKAKVGTVHTFQGKEAPMVILLLGGRPDRPGAFDWAAARPNLLNVAVTRAKRALYVVGDRSRWRSLPYFERLDAELP